VGGWRGIEVGVGGWRGIEGDGHFTRGRKTVPQAL
jgi:hypothetical protein